MATEDDIEAPLHSAHRMSIFAEKNPIEIAYQITIKAKMKNQPDKIILHPQQGIIPA